MLPSTERILSTHCILHVLTALLHAYPSVYYLLFRLKMAERLNRIQYSELQLVYYPIKAKAAHRASVGKSVNILQTTEQVHSDFTRH